MELTDLKLKVTTGQIDDSLLILKYTDNKFMSMGYVDMIASIKGLKKVYIDSLNEMDSENAFDAPTNLLYVLSVENLTERPEADTKNLIIVCKQLPTDLAVDYVEMPEVQDWMITERIKQKCPGLDDTAISWLTSLGKTDIYRLENELNKIKLFPEGFQNTLFNDMLMNGDYVELIGSENFFDLANAIFNLDLIKIQDILSRRDFLDLEPDIVLSSLIRSYTDLSKIYFAQTWNPNICKTEKQFKYFKAVICKKYKPQALPNIIEMLTEIDYKLKQGQLNYNIFVDYIIPRIFEYAC